MTSITDFLHPFQTEHIKLKLHVTGPVNKLPVSHETISDWFIYKYVSPNS